MKNPKKLTGPLATLNTATHGAIAKAVQQGDLESKAGSTLLLSATDAWAKLGLKALLGGTLASYLSASIAGILIG